MKLFKRLLSVALVAVLALTMMTACSVDPDQEYIDNYAYTVHTTFNKKSDENSQGVLTYSRSCSEWTKIFLDEYTRTLSGNDATECAAETDEVIKLKEQCKQDTGYEVVVSLITSNGTQVNPVHSTNAGDLSDAYAAILAQSNYSLSTHIGIARNTATGYEMICTFKKAN